MLHLGDITKIDGAKVPAVEVVIGGSPCQDLSVAGKRAGLAGERSGLFMEQIRIIKEMRRESERSGATLIIPRYMVWENVPGAFSSNGGEDFRTVLEETARVADASATIPRPTENWTNAGAVMGNGWSIAWRVLDAQFWGVPQRRRRIALVADFGGYTAPEILFERNSLSRNTSPSSTPWKDFASAFAERFGGSNRSRRSLKNDAVIYGGSQITSRTCRSNPKIGDPCHTLHAFGAGQSYCVAVGTDVNDQAILSYGFPLGFRPENVRTYKEKATTICNGTRAGFCNGVIINFQDVLDCAACDLRSVTENYEVNGTLQSRMSNNLNSSNVIRVSKKIRRLTPLECERLQGYPGGWTDIGTYTDSHGKERKTSDSARYKALGNSIALPPWAWVLERLNYYCIVHTMASLFDGIGGFPLIWETLNGGGSCLWASEIEEFPIAVTKNRFK